MTLESQAGRRNSSHLNPVALVSFLVSQGEYEVNGVTWDADRKPMFLKIQLPGDQGGGHLPGGGHTFLRSTVIGSLRIAPFSKVSNRSSRFTGTL